MNRAERRREQRRQARQQRSGQVDLWPVQAASLFEAAGAPFSCGCSRSDAVTITAADIDSEACPVPDWSAEYLAELESWFGPGLVDAVVLWHRCPVGEPLVVSGGGGFMP